MKGIESLVEECCINLDKFVSMRGIISHKVNLQADPDL